MIIFLTISVILLATIDVYLYMCIYGIYKALKIMIDNDRVLKDNLIEVMSWERK